MAYRTIVVGTDGSDTARRAVERAAELAAADNARLVVTTAFERHGDTPDDAIPSDVRWMLTDSNAAETHAREGREAAHAAGVTDVVVQAVAGAPAEMLIETAETFSADLIVVGSVGLTASAHFLLGSVASTVLHHAPADVLVVHTAS
ncbi:universal stress protein [Actinospongicola halichondriae]|uniref:universal stress protein n=1 Tax=Actinospongicola halichondriae TaxID=3236844 RepID=UPI003D476A53